MSYLEHHTEDTWQKRLFDKLMSVEDKLNLLLVKQSFLPCIFCMMF